MKKVYLLFIFLNFLMVNLHSESISTEQEQRIMQMSYPVHGTLRPKFVTRVSSQVGGKIQEVFVDIGDFVKKDQVVVHIDPLFFEIEYKKSSAALQIAKAGFEDAEVEFKRMKNLWEKQEGEKPSIPKKQFDEAKFRLIQKKFLLEQASIDLDFFTKRLEETCVKVPYDGVVTRRFVDPGESVTVTPIVPLIEIMDISKLVLEFSLPQDLQERVTEGLDVTLKIEENKKLIQGKIEKIFPQVDEATRSLKCRMIIDNSDLSLKPGLSVFGEVYLKSKSG